MNQVMQSSAEYVPNQAEEEAVAAIEEAGHNLEAINAYRSNVGEDYTKILEWEDWIGDFEEAYQGQMSTREFAEQLADDLGFLEELSRISLAHYFDYDKWERDLFMGDYWESKGFIFRSL